MGCECLWVCVTNGNHRCVVSACEPVLLTKNCKVGCECLWVCVTNGKHRCIVSACGPVLLTKPVRWLLTCATNDDLVGRGRGCLWAWISNNQTVGGLVFLWASLTKTHTVESWMPINLH